jgi:hypothetical protein
MQADASLIFGHFVTSQWLPAIEHTVRPSTFTSYRSHVMTHIAPLIGVIRIDNLDAAALNAFYAERWSAEELRAGEVCHPRPSAAYTLDLSSGRAAIAQTVILVGGVVQKSHPKTRRARRVIALDA